MGVRKEAFDLYSLLLTKTGQQRTLLTFVLPLLGQTQCGHGEWNDRPLDGFQVKKLEPPKKGNRITYDDAVAGFGCRVTAGGARSFILNYRTWGGRERRYTIGSFPDGSVVAAREHAGTLKQFVDQGGDPLGEKQEQREAPTVADLVARFAKEHLPRRRQATADLYRSALQKYILPQLGKRKVADVQFEDVDTMLRRITDTGGPIIANRCEVVLSKMMSLSIRWRMRTDIPARASRRTPSNSAGAI